MMSRIKLKKGYTLVEILIAVSLFAIVGMISLGIFINVTRIQAQLALENAIYEDARFMMERISRSIRNNAIDYEEYFNKAIDSDNYYGEMFGCYAGHFYNPGLGNPSNLTANPGDLGALCNDGTAYVGQECVVYKPSIDINTGMYPYLGAAAPVASNAFCPAYPFATACGPVNDNTKSELYLISADGTRKTLYARKQVTAAAPLEYALALVEINGMDTDKDGITETWRGCGSGANEPCCDEDSYDCSGIPSLEANLLSGASADLYKGFVPISPLRTTVTKLTFNIIPGDDPRKSFAESSTVLQPRVRITLEVQPSASQLALIGNPTGNDIPRIVLQTTVSSRIQSEVKSYLGPDTHALTSHTGSTCLL